MNNHSFNLLDKPWIPVLHANGDSNMVGLRELFLDFKSIVEIDTSYPLEELAITRLLVAISHAALRGPKNFTEWKSLADAGNLGNRVVEYLDQQEENFDLFGDKPFFQTGEDFNLKNGIVQKISVSNLSFLKSSGKNACLISHDDNDNPDPITPDQAIRELLVAQAWAVPGGRGFNSSRLQGRVMIVIPHGETLYRTILHCLMDYDPQRELPLPAREDDLPVWERDNNWDTSRLVEGYLDLLTFPLRRVKLMPDDDGQIRWMQYMPGLKISDGIQDPWVSCQINKEGEPYPRKMSTDEQIWRSIPALVEDTVKASKTEERKHTAKLLVNERYRYEQLYDSPQLQPWPQTRIYIFYNDQSKFHDSYKMSSEIPHQMLNLKRSQLALENLKLALSSSKSVSSKLNKHINILLGVNEKRAEKAKRTISGRSKDRFWDSVRNLYYESVPTIDNEEQWDWLVLEKTWRKTLLHTTLKEYDRALREIVGSTPNGRVLAKTGECRQGLIREVGNIAKKIQFMTPEDIE